MFSICLRLQFCQETRIIISRIEILEYQMELSCPWKNVEGISKFSKKKVLKRQNGDGGRVKEIEFCSEGDMHWWECSHDEIEEILYKFMISKY